jgi:chromosomal replication initiation ATPase DnaA
MAFARDIIAYGADLFGFTTEEIIQHDRHKEVTMARHAIFLALRRRGVATAQIGRFMGRDRSTVRGGIGKAIYLEERNPDYAKAIQLIAEFVPNYAGEQHDRRLQQ